MTPEKRATRTPEQTFADQLRRIRLQRGDTQQDIADRARSFGFPMTQQTVAKIEGGKRPIRLDEADVLAIVLGTTVTELLTPIMSVKELRAALKFVETDIKEWSEEIMKRDVDIRRASDALEEARRGADYARSFVANCISRRDQLRTQLDAQKGESA